MPVDRYLEWSIITNVSRSVNVHRYSSLQVLLPTVSCVGISEPSQRALRMPLVVEYQHEITNDSDEVQSK